MGIGNLKISVKTTIPVIILALFALFIAWLGTSSTTEVNRLNTNGLHADQKVGMIQNLIINVMGLGRIEFRIAAQPTETMLKEGEENLLTRVGQAETIIKGLQSHIEKNPNQTPPEKTRNATEKEKLTAILEYWARYKVELEKTRAAISEVRANLPKTDAERYAVTQKMAENASRSRAVSLELEKLIQNYAQFIAGEARSLSEQADQGASDAERNLWGMAIGSIVLGSLLAFAISQFGIVKPIRTVVTALKELADGQLGIDIPGTGRRDEIGEIARTMLVFKENALRVQHLQEEQERQKQQAEVENRQAMNALADSFDVSVRRIVQTVSSAATEMQASSATLTDIAQQTAHQAENAVSASERSTVNVQTVASAAEELSSSISEISRQIGTSSQVAGNAAIQAQKTIAMTDDVVYVLRNPHGGKHQYFPPCRMAHHGPDQTSIDRA